MTTMYHPDRRSGVPPIIVIDARDLPVRASATTPSPAEEKIVVIHPDPSVSHAFCYFRGSFGMLAQALCRSIGKYFARINRGYDARRRNI